jgi:hypothetical protein
MFILLVIGYLMCIYCAEETNSDEDNILRLVRAVGCALVIVSCCIIVGNINRENSSYFIVSGIEKYEDKIKVNLRTDESNYQEMYVKEFNSKVGDTLWIKK